MAHEHRQSAKLIARKLQIFKITTIAALRPLHQDLVEVAQNASLRGREEVGFAFSSRKVYSPAEQYGSCQTRGLLFKMSYERDRDRILKIV